MPELEEIPDAVDDTVEDGSDRTTGSTSGGSADNNNSQRGTGRTNESVEDSSVRFREPLLDDENL